MKYVIFTHFPRIKAVIFSETKFLPKRFKLFGFPTFQTLNVTDESYLRNAPCDLN